MNFKLGNFYMDPTGRMIAILDKINSYAWGEMIIVEECVPVVGGIEHYISSIILDHSNKEGNWTEIGKSEWMTNFNKGGNV
jgi:hypothetical protein